MDDESDPKPACCRDKCEHCIECCGPLGMERMKANAAAIWVEDGISEKVINIDDHRAECLPAAGTPAIFSSRTGQRGRNRKVHDHMDKETHGEELV